MATDELPVELWIEIFLALQLHKEQKIHPLAACSLVSRKWREITLPIHFSRIRFGFRRDRPFTAFYTFLETSPHLAPYIKTLTLLIYKEEDSMPFGAAGDTTTIASDQPVLIGCDELFAILPRLTSLHTLRVRLGDIAIPLSFGQITPFRLRTLGVDGSRGPFTAADGLRGLSAILSIISPNHLILSYMSGFLYAPRLVVDMQDLRPISTHLHRLVLNNTCSVVYHEYLTSILAADCLEYLFARFEGPNTSASLRLLVDSAGRHLTSLFLDLRLTVFEKDPYGWLKCVAELLSLCSQLQQLWLAMPYYIVNHTSTVILTRYHPYDDTLSAMSATLTKLTIHLKTASSWYNAPDDTSFEFFDLAALDRSWLRGRFVHLRSVVLEDSLPALREAGLLHISEDYPSYLAPPFE
ncbi:hypothetical protein C8Q80DRAFT_1265876 [Daedaleopsis nitida]|nr:hypothetical protein C8Q80DRAFT_1265876 [Daedaleopsis nitida]